MKWTDIKIPGVTIHRIAGMFEIWAGGKLPFPTFRIKIIERPGAGFAGFLNVAVKNRADGSAEWTGGLGDSLESALEVAIANFFQEIEKHKPDHELTEADFLWALPENF
jgi:hypothetical protein